MSTTVAGMIFIVSLIVALGLVYKPLGDHMYRVYSTTRHSAAERGIYRLLGVRADAEQGWGMYARSLLAFSLISILVVYGVQRLQDKLPLSLGMKPVTDHIAWNTAVSFVTNTNWQAYSGESTMGHLTQMAALAVQNFVSAAVGMAVAVALVRGFARRRSDTIGNFWVDLVRGTIRILLPMAFIGALVLVAGGLIQNFSGPHEVSTLAGGGDPANLARQRTLVESMGGTYHQVVGDDIPRALLDFARGVNATQLVLGASRRGRFAQILSRGVGVETTTLSGPIDVHLVTHEEAKKGRRRPERSRAVLTRKRRLTGWAVAVAGMPLLTAALIPFRDVISLPSEILFFLSLTVGVALIGGMWPAITAAVGGSLLLNWFFTPPIGQLTISDPENLFALVVFVLVAAAVSTIVDIAARRTREAARARADAEALSTLAGHVLRGEAALPSLLGRLRETFSLDSVTLLERAGEPTPDDQSEPGAWRIVATTGATPCTVPATADTDVQISDRLVLAARGRLLDASDRRVLEAFAAEAAVALRQERLQEEAEQAKPLAEADRMRTALLAAVSHDLRTPLSAAKASVESLRSKEIDWSPEDRDELLDTAQESLARLDRLVENLLDMSRLQAGVLGLSLQPLALEEVVPRAIDDLGALRDRIEGDISIDLPEIVADPALLERVLVNLMTNAVRHSPAGQKVLITASWHEDQVEIRVIDRGPGIPPEAHDRVFQPFQRLGDRDNGTGVGLGLALSRGLTEAMAGTLVPEETPGGGLTMIIRMPISSQAVTA
ncbi:potassium-transporting ATPase subunit KdpA [Nonomuraea sp. NPDC049400]|uniref:potassium-transporting ATPase subunit KdpA n=1 Tax=Nonomuraea sp. NPDC049400 TaxID=3364352 RepID=UPI0037941780